MGIKTLVQKYKTYETTELDRRRARRKITAPYKELSKNAKIKKYKKSAVKKFRPMGKITYKRINKALDDPYGEYF